MTKNATYCDKHVSSWKCIFVVRWCVDDELLALELQMTVSPTLNSLTQIWLWWKEDSSGKQLGEAYKSRF